MLVLSAYSAPTSMLYQPVCAVDVEPLLAIPLQWTTKSLELVGARELIASWEDISTKNHPTIGAVCSGLKGLHRQFQALRLQRSERVPCRDLLPIDRDGQGRCPIRITLEQPVKDHAQILMGSLSK